MSLKSVSNSFVLSNNLIDFNSPNQSNCPRGLLKPLIPEPKLIFPLLSPRESIGDNNPFDKVFKEATKSTEEIDDPFEIVCEKAKQFDNIKVNVNDISIIDDDTDSSLGILDDTVFTNDSLNASIPTTFDIPITPCLLNSSTTDQEIRDSIAQRVNRCIEQASPGHRFNLSLDLKRSHSNSYLGISNQFSSISGGDTACSSLNRGGFLNTASTFEEFSSRSNFLDINYDNAFHEHLQRRPSYNQNPVPLVGRKSLSARKPNELSSLERCRLMNYSSNIFNFKERLKLIANVENQEDNELKIEHLKTEELNDSLCLEVKKLTETNENGSIILNGKLSSSDLSKEEVYDLRTHTFDKSQIFKDQIIPNKITDINENQEQINSNHNKSIDHNKSNNHSNQSKNWKKDAIKVLENIIQVLKTDSDNDTNEADAFNQNDILTNVAKIINEKQQQENLDSTVSCDSSDDFIEVRNEPIPRNKPPQMRKSYSFNNVGQRKIETKSLKTNGKIETSQQPLKNLRPKHAQSEIGGKKGPLKAVIPIDIMTKDSTTVKNSKPQMSNIKSSRMISSTPKTENVSKVKPVAQSTPTNSTSSKLKSRKSNVAFSPISRYSKKSNNDSLNSTYSPPTKSLATNNHGAFEINRSSSVTKSQKKLSSVQSSSELNKKTSSSNQLLTRRKSASELKVSFDKKMVDNQSMKLFGNNKNKLTALRPLNNLMSKIYRSSSIPGNSIGKENINVR